MLEHDCRIAKGIKGIDPNGTDKERSEAEQEWFKQHPVITEAEKEAMRATVDRLKKAKSREDIDKNQCRNRAQTGFPAKRVLGYP
jgi:hypothetical protein